MEIRALADKDLERGTKLCISDGTEDTNRFIYISFYEMLEQRAVRCSAYLHTALSSCSYGRRSSWQKRVHVFMEKPPAISTEEF